MSRSPRDTVVQFWRTANERRWDEFAELLHPAMTYHVPPPRASAWLKRYEIPPEPGEEVR